jgi:hypothetical protein
MIGTDDRHAVLSNASKNFHVERTGSFEWGVDHGEPRESHRSTNGNLLLMESTVMNMFTACTSCRPTHEDEDSLVE